MLKQWPGGGEAFTSFPPGHLPGLTRACGALVHRSFALCGASSAPDWRAGSAIPAGGGADGLWCGRWGSVGWWVVWAMGECWVVGGAWGQRFRVTVTVVNVIPCRCSVSIPPPPPPPSCLFLLFLSFFLAFISFFLAFISFFISFPNGCRWCHRLLAGRGLQCNLV